MKGKSKIARIPENVRDQVRDVAERFDIPATKSFNILMDDAQVIGMKEERGGKNRFLEVTYKKRFRL